MNVENSRFDGSESSGKPECPECPDDAEYSVSKAGAANKTLAMGPGEVWDADGNYHPSVDPNWIERRYSCSNGHSWTDRKRADPQYEEKMEARREAREEGLLPANGDSETEQ